jgi:alpha-D-xyloside xylohydrolase
MSFARVAVAPLLFAGGLVAAGCHAAPDPCAPPQTAADRAAAPARHTPRWAFEPWISKDISDTDDTYAFIDGFATRDIPVGVVVLDSPWETHYNTFVPNPVRYHDFDKLVADLHARDVRLVLWITQMVNNYGMDFETGGDTYTGESPNFEAGKSCKFYVDEGDTYVWWKGTGAGVDFFNRHATAWWHRQQDALLDLGIDGWKLDFGDSYIPSSEIETAVGSKPHQEYSEAYYHDYLSYGVARRGSDFLTMVRGWDESYGFAGRFYARPEDAPVVWAGDNRRDWVGLADALFTMFKSARAGYVVVGSDIGGYLDFDDKSGATVPASQTTFARWTAIGALSPFMQLHGRANLTPWTIPERPDETVALYRDWSVLHHELVPFFYSLAEAAYAGGPALLDPIGDESAWAGDFRYTLGGVLLVAPILDDTGRRDVALPAGARWYDWWASDTTPPVDGGTTVAGYDATDRSRVPLFVKEGAILPMRSSVRVWPAAEPSSFVVQDDDGGTTRIDAAATSDGASATVTFSRVREATELRVRLPSGMHVVAVAASADPQTLSVP